MNIGHVFQGKYRVDEILGHGGMGVVAKCVHLQLNESVAIKMLRKDVLDDHDAVERFMREAQAAVKLRSEYVARVSDVGTFENGVPYMVMEFLDGHDLGELLDERGFLPAPWATEMMLQAAEALAEAHSIGIVHRDVKPTNLFVTWRPDGSALVKVLDFGIARAPIGTDMKLTQTQSLLGTPAYMSPEQMRSARLVDARSDIWSLGTVMYELLEGRRPFEAESFSEMCVKVAVDQPSPMTKSPPALQQVVLRCLAKSPEQRYANMAELGAALIPFARDPHAAGILVERMQRMHDRGGHVDWASGTPATATLPPESQALLAVAAAAAAAAAPKHDVVPVPAVIVKPPREIPRRQRDVTDTTLKGPPRRRRRNGFLVLAAAAIIGVAIGLSIFAIRRDDGEAVAEPAKPALPEPPVTATEVEVAVPDPKPPEVDVRVEPAVAPPVTNKKPSIEKRPAVKIPKDGSKGIVKPVEPPQPPKPACDVYADPHRCQT